jgi:hypothetical protein
LLTALAGVFTLLAQGTGLFAASDPTPIAYEIDAVRRGGDPTPIGRGYNSFSDPLEVAPEGVAFQGHLETLFRISSEGLIEVGVASGDLVPELGGALVNLGGGSSNSTGEVAFHARFRTATGESGTGLFVTSETGPRLLADEQDLAYLGFGARFSPTNQLSPSINDRGEVATLLSRSGDDAVVFVSPEGDLTVVDPSAANLANPRLGDSGTVVYFRNADDSLNAWQGSGELLLRRGDAAPVPTGGTISGLYGDRFALSPSGKFLAACVRTRPAIGSPMDYVLLLTLPAERSSCCVAHDSAGCDTRFCEAAVCEIASFCCDSSWDEPCASVAESLCPGTCASVASAAPVAGAPELIFESESGPSMNPPLCSSTPWGPCSPAPPVRSSRSPSLPPGPISWPFPVPTRARTPSSCGTVQPSRV